MIYKNNMSKKLTKELVKLLDTARDSIQVTKNIVSGLKESVNIADEKLSLLDSIEEIDQSEIEEALMNLHEGVEKEEGEIKVKPLELIKEEEIIEGEKLSKEEEEELVKKAYEGVPLEILLGDEKKKLKKKKKKKKEAYSDKIQEVEEDIEGNVKEVLDDTYPVIQDYKQFNKAWSNSKIKKGMRKGEKGTREIKKIIYALLVSAVSKGVSMGETFDMIEEAVLDIRQKPDVTDSTFNIVEHVVKIIRKKMGLKPMKESKKK